MVDSLFQFLAKYIEVTEELKQALRELDLLRSFPKGTLLLKEGDLCEECFFILKGLVRSYYVVGTEEVTTDFFLEEQVASPSCYGTQVPSPLYLECLEDTVAFVGTPAAEAQMLSRFPQLLVLGKLMGESLASSYQDNFDRFRLASPEQRYRELARSKPQFLQRVPQYLIATYLGIRPESLSRIRKRLSVERSHRS